MKLNLLPATVTRGRASRVAAVISALIGIGAIVGAVLLSTSSKARLDAAQARHDAARPQADQVVAQAAVADQVILQAGGVIRNTNLSNAMIAHSPKYPQLYDKVTRYVPAFYRLTSISASPGDPPGAPPAGAPAGAAPAPSTGTAVVTMTGVLTSYQQYADLMLALMRVPGARSIARAGYTLLDPVVPNLSTEDQVGRPRLEGAAPIPDDPLARLEYFQAQGSLEGYLGTGNFGSGSNLTRGPMPQDSVVTVTLVVEGHDLRVPDARSSLTAPAPGSNAGGAPAPGPGPGSVPPPPAPGLPGGAEA